MPRSTPRAVCCGLGGRRLVGCLTARPPHRGRFRTQGAPRSAATPGLWSVTPSAYSEARRDIDALAQQEAVPGSLGGGARRPVVYLSTVLYREAVTLRSPGSPRSSSTSWRGERLEETAPVPVLTFVAPVSHFALTVYFSLRTLCQVGDPAPGVRYRDSCRLAEGQFSP